MDGFIGRKDELDTLQTVLGQRSASFIVVNGRRRIGKSRLIAEFAKSYKYYVFNGLPPRKGITAEDQRKEFMRQFREQFEFPSVTVSDWGDIFSLLGQQTKQGRIVILFDEITWMAIGDPDFLGKLKIAWDTQFSKNSKLILFLCGSVSSWIEKNLLSSTAYLGRPTLHIQLDELPLADCKRFWGAKAEAISAYEKFKILSVTGGVPRYLELINPNLTAEDNLRNLFFKKESALYDEFKYIFTDIYTKKNELYKRVVEYLVNGKKTQEQIAEKLEIAQSGELSEYLDALIKGGFVARDYTWQIKVGKPSNLSYYRLKDNYMRFALKYILPNMPLIEKGRFQSRSLKTLPGWESILGLQFENLILSNHNEIINKLGILQEDIVFDNPYFQRKTKRQPGCQIDYMIQTQHDTVYVCEIRFSRNPIDNKIIEEMQKRLARLKLPKNISVRPVLIHVNGVNESVEDSLFFTKIIDFSEMLHE